MRVTCAMCAAAVALVLVAAAARLGAQDAPRQYAEFRADAIFNRGTTVQGGAGLVIPFGTYMRLGVDGAAGARWSGGETHASGRVDAIGRFLLDPFREAPVGLSLGGGVSVPVVSDGTRVRPYLTAVVDIEGRHRGPWTPAVQIGLGGGFRVGVVVRASTPRWR